MVFVRISIKSAMMFSVKRSHATDEGEERVRDNGAIYGQPTAIKRGKCASRERLLRFRSAQTAILLRLRVNKDRVLDKHEPVRFGGRQLITTCNVAKIKLINVEDIYRGNRYLKSVESKVHNNKIISNEEREKYKS